MLIDGRGPRMRPRMAITISAAMLALGMAGGAQAQAASGGAAPAKFDPPAGWAFLPETMAYGGGDIFHIVAGGAVGGPRPQMRVLTHQNAAIITRDVDVPLTEATTLKWRWLFEKIPTKFAETLAANHDYISIAVKFDNGQDLTYMWSVNLAPGTGFHCPLPGWEHRETHAVIRSGEADLGRWLEEERPILADYKRYIDVPPPHRITQIWIIANSFIQKGDGEASFGDISLGDAGGKRLRVF